MKAQVAGDLFRAPALAQVVVNDTKVGGIELGVTPSARAAMPGTAVRLAWPVMAIRGAGIAPKFTRDGAWRTTQLSGNLGLRKTLLAQCREHIPFSRGELVVRHD